MRCCSKRLYRGWPQHPLVVAWPLLWPHFSGLLICHALLDPWKERLSQESLVPYSCSHVTIQHYKPHYPWNKHLQPSLTMPLPYRCYHSICPSPESGPSLAPVSALLPGLLRPPLLLVSIPKPPDPTSALRLLSLNPWECSVLLYCLLRSSFHVRSQGGTACLWPWAYAPFWSGATLPADSAPFRVFSLLKIRVMPKACYSCPKYGGLVPSESGRAPTGATTSGRDRASGYLQVPPAVGGGQSWWAPTGAVSGGSPVRRGMCHPLPSLCIVCGPKSDIADQ